MKNAGVKYAAWHAARRGLASNAYELGADDLTVQRTLRHGSVQVTRASYIKLRDARVDSAMAKLSDRYGDGTDAIDGAR
jgi:integrase